MTAPHTCQPLAFDGPRPWAAAASMLALPVDEKAVLMALAADSWDGLTSAPPRCCLRLWAGLGNNAERFYKVRARLRDKGLVAYDDGNAGGSGKTTTYRLTFWNRTVTPDASNRTVRPNGSAQNRTENRTENRSENRSGSPDALSPPLPKKQQAGEPERQAGEQERQATRLKASHQPWLDNLSDEEMTELLTYIRKNRANLNNPLVALRDRVEALDLIAQWQADRQRREEERQHNRADTAMTVLGIPTDSETGGDAYYARILLHQALDLRLLLVEEIEDAECLDCIAAMLADDTIGLNELAHAVRVTPNGEPSPAYLRGAEALGITLPEPTGQPTTFTIGSQGEWPDDRRVIVPIST